MAGLGVRSAVEGQAVELAEQDAIPNLQQPAAHVAGEDGGPADEERVLDQSERAAGGLTPLDERRIGGSVTELALEPAILQRRSLRR